MAFGIKIEVWGDYASFNRPEMKVERVSYDVMTPSAARGILEAIYWKPEMRWVVDEIRVLAPIRFLNLRRNEVAGTISTRNAAGKSGGQGPLGINVAEQRQQRAATILRDVRYGISAHIEVIDAGETKAPEAKHLEMFKRRAVRGQYFHHPYLGTREFPASFTLVDEFSEPHPELSEGDQPKDLGYMLLDIEYSESPKGTIVESNRGRRLDATPHFFRASMKNGVIRVPPIPAPKGE